MHIDFPGLRRHRLFPHFVRNTMDFQIPESIDPLAHNRAGLGSRRSLVAMRNRTSFEHR